MDSERETIREQELERQLRNELLIGLVGLERANIQVLFDLEHAATDPEIWLPFLKGSLEYRLLKIDSLFDRLSAIDGSPYECEYALPLPDFCSFLS